MSLWKILGVALLVAVIVVGGYLAGAWLHLYGVHEGPGEPTEGRRPQALVATQARAQQRAAAALSSAPSKQILFGDLHVHTTFSTDAFLWSLQMLQGDGAHPVADACDYARFCSALDFWSINDHAEASTPRKWRETREAIRQCNALAGDPDDPDLVSFLGWEWSQVGRTPETHYGHKNVVLLGLEDEEVPARAIGAGGLATDGLRGSVGAMSPVVALLDLPHRQRYYDFIEFMDEVRAVDRCPAGVASPELPSDCYESADTPGDLFRKLDEWGMESMVIPHGNTWGFYSPPGTTWDKQLTPAQHDPERQYLIEVMSGHGNSEEYRDWRAIRYDAEGNPVCPEPSDDYLPTCWRAGELVEQRCRAEGGDEAACTDRAAEARVRALLFGAAANLMVPDADFEEWLDAGQCNDCFLPSFNYRPGGSSQYALAISHFDGAREPERFHFGFLASSDNHRARPGTGYKEFDRKRNTESSGAVSETWRQRILAPRSGVDPWIPIENEDALVEEVLGLGFVALEAERQASFFSTGGLVAVHATGRDRRSVWNGLRSREVYGTSGDRILLWFNLLNAERPDGSFGALPMGSETRMGSPPRFEVRAVGAFQQKPGCPAYGVDGPGQDRLEWLCRGECYNPSERRKLVTRIEVVRIRPQQTPGEPVARLIEDPWRVLPCEPSQAGCVVQFEDADFASAGRDAVYYVRAIEEPSPSVNAGQLRCERDADGRCLEVKPCYGDYRSGDDDCLEMIEERAWSSPIYVDFAAGAP